MFHRRGFFLAAVVMCAAVGGYAAAQSDSPPHMLVFERAPGPDTPALRDFAAGARTDAEIAANAADYFALNRDRLALLWREPHPTRLAALYSMYVTHISHPYGETPAPASLLDHVGLERAHCGTYVYAQQFLADALGLTHRSVEFYGEHAWMEVQIDGAWETFDATTNTWLSGGVLDLLAGAPREFRHFYTPMLDVTRPDARLHFAEGYDMQRLRARMPGLGVFYHPPGELRIAGERVAR